MSRGLDVESSFHLRVIDPNYLYSSHPYYLKKNYLYYYFIILFLEFANCFQLFISSIPIYVVHIYAT